MSFLSTLNHKIQIYTNLLFLPFLRFQRRLKNNQSFVILCYHRVRERTNIFYDQNISATPKEFKKQMLYIKRYFSVISLNQLIDCSRSKYTLKPNSVIITFDDGYKDNALYAFPVLEELSMPATVFITTGFNDSDAIPWEDQISYLFNTISNDEMKLDDGQIYSLKTPEHKERAMWLFCKKLKYFKPAERDEMTKALCDRYKINTFEMQQLANKLFMGYMSNKDIQYWDHHGIDFGCHTVTHPCLTTLSEEKMFEEVSASKKMVEEILEKSIDAFAYPYGKEGDFNNDSKACLKNAGLNVGITFEAGKNSIKSDLRKLKRMGVGNGVNFKMACHGSSCYSGIIKEIGNLL